jgi:hypothetical protein
MITPMNFNRPSRIHIPKEFAMTRLASFNFAQFASDAPAHATSGRSGGSVKVESSKTLAGLLLAAVLAALLVVADQLIDTWADGHLLAAWVALWTVAFAGLALLAPPLRKMSASLASAYARSAAIAKQRRAEEMMWEYARRDPRIMAELQHAWMRDHSEA